MATADETELAQVASCAPCRGTGTVISLLGGQISQVRCPWCEGTGHQLPGHDAQAARVAGAASA